jgi:hypothetical protein
MWKHGDNIKQYLTNEAKQYGIQWLNLVIVLCDPPALVLSILIFLLVRHSSDTNPAMDQNVLALVTILISLLSALVGARWIKRWQDLTETPLLSGRALPAVRLLKQAAGVVVTLQTSGETFFASCNGSTVSTAITKRNYEEIIKLSKLLKDDVFASIQNWHDVVPEANLNSLFSDYDTLKQELATANVQLKMMREKSEDRNTEESRKHAKEIEAKEKMINELLTRLQEQRFAIGPRLLSPSMTYVPYISGPGVILNTGTAFSFPFSVDTTAPSDSAPQSKEPDASPNVTQAEKSQPAMEEQPKMASGKHSTKSRKHE